MLQKQFGVLHEFVNSLWTLFKVFFFFNWRIIALQIVLISAVQWDESAV